MNKIDIPKPRFWDDAHIFHPDHFSSIAGEENHPIFMFEIFPMFYSITLTWFGG